MQVSVTGHHVEVTPPLRSYIEKKLERIVRHYDSVIDVHCVLTVEKQRQKAEATLQVRGGSIHADAINEDMYAAIDALPAPQRDVIVDQAIRGETFASISARTGVAPETLAARKRYALARLRASLDDFA